MPFVLFLLAWFLFLLLPLTSTDSLLQNRTGQTNRHMHSRVHLTKNCILTLFSLFQLLKTRTNRIRDPALSISIALVLEQRQWKSNLARTVKCSTRPQKSARYQQMPLKIQSAHATTKSHSKQVWQVCQCLYSGNLPASFVFVRSPYKQSHVHEFGCSSTVFFRASAPGAFHTDFLHWFSEKSLNSLNFSKFTITKRKGVLFWKNTVIKK